MSRWERTNRENREQPVQENIVRSPREQRRLEAEQMQQAAVSRKGAVPLKILCLDFSDSDRYYAGIHGCLFLRAEQDKCGTVYGYDAGRRRCSAD